MCIEMQQVHLLYIFYPSIKILYKVLKCVCVYNYSTSKAQKFISLEIGCCSQLIPLNRLFAQVEIFQRQGYSTQEKILPQRFCTEYT